MKSLVARRNRCISASTFRGSWSRSCQRVFLLQKFEFVDLEDAKYMYETLMGSSRRLRYGRRRVLQVAYQLFCGTSYSRFGRVILEKRETQTNLRIAVTKSARVVQTASAREIANTAKSKHKPEAGKRPHDGSLFGQDIAIENSQNCTSPPWISFQVLALVVPRNRDLMNLFPGTLTPAVPPIWIDDETDTDTET
ncbi:hypothetical protein B0O80DRAFT_497847 [Mortierella sp. GBAus27b]|nr:hypothetical protein B0O80DRAFT_497847 [Mortierella sp. GBAus27b]